MINCCNCYRTDGKRNDCYYHIQAMTATLSLEYAAIVVSVLYRMLTKQPPRNIYCLEGNWRTNPRCKQSVRPMLDILRDAAGIKYIYRKCNTREEFFEYLRQYTFERYRNYPILYIAFHGRPNKIQIGRDLVTLREIADVLEGFLAHRIVYFGSCSTMRTKRANIDDFLHRTKADILAGYSKDVDFIQATAWEMVWLYNI